MKFRYIDANFAMSTVVGTTYQTLHVFRGNSLYDPDYTGVGVQPYGYDNWCSSTAFFSAYSIVASKMTIYISTSASAANCPKIMIYVIPTDRTSFGNHSDSDLLLIPHVKARSIGIGDYKTGSQLKLTHYATTSQILGRNKAMDDDNVAAYNANPSVAWYWHVYVDSNTWNYEADVSMDVKITYYAKLSGPNSQTYS